MNNSVISGKNIYNHLLRINFPRRAGSKGNEKCFNILIEYLENIGYKYKIEKYYYRNTYFS